MLLLDRPVPQDLWLPGFNFNVEEWDAKGRTYETPAICRSLALARAIAEKPAARSREYQITIE
jgi:hypothetical protein